MTDARRPLALIAAMTKHRVIGKDGGIPWRLPEDLRHFREATIGRAVIMGRKTFDSIGRPLPHRTNIVLSRRPTVIVENIAVVDSLDVALEYAWEYDREPFVIGGAQIYALALPLATRMVLTEVDADVDGDTFFPEFDASEWTERSRLRREACTFVELRRKETTL